MALQGILKVGLLALCKYSMAPAEQSGSAEGSGSSLRLVSSKVKVSIQSFVVRINI